MILRNIIEYDNLLYDQLFYDSTQLVSWSYYLDFLCQSMSEEEYQERENLIQKVIVNFILLLLLLLWSNLVSKSM